MRESMWGIFIIILGAVGIVAVNLFQDLTITNDQTHFLLKESTKAAMGDSIDIAYYRTTGNLRIVEGKFLENLTRRFAESAVLNKDYNIIVHDIVEQPPKVSISIMTNADDLSGGKYEIFEKIDSIYEAVYKTTDLFDPKYDIENDCKPGRTCKPETGNPYEDGKCPNADSTADICILGDLKFNGWGISPMFMNEQCPEDLKNLTPKDRDAKYEECICDAATNTLRWSGEIIEVVNSGMPVVSGNKATYTWTFIKNGPYNDINSTTKKEIISGICGDIECSPKNSSILKNETVTLTPKHIPENAINRDIIWTASPNGRVTLLDKNPPIIFPNVDKVTVTGNSLGEATITGTTKIGSGRDSCNVVVTTCDGVVLELGSSSYVKFKEGTFVHRPSYSYSVDNPSIAMINPSTGLITTYSAGQTSYSIDVNGIKNEKCNIIVTAKPKKKVFCPPNIIEIPANSSGVASVTDSSGKLLTGEGVGIWGYNGSANDISVSTSGTITSSSNTSYNSLQYFVNLNSDYVNGNNNSNTISCNFRVFSPDTEGCTVGTTWGRWESKTLPDLCPQDISYQTSKYRSSLYREVTPVFCGFLGNYNSCSNGIVSSRPSIGIHRASSPTASGVRPGATIDVSTSSTSYTVTWSFHYNYDGWNGYTLSGTNCLAGKNKTIPVSSSKTGRLLSKDDPLCKEIKTDKDDSITITEPTSSTIDAFAGSTGAIVINVFATFSEDCKNSDGQLCNYGDIGWSINGRGSISPSSRKGRDIVYTPPKTTTGTVNNPEIVTITAIHPISARKTDLLTIKLYPKKDCSRLSIDGPRYSCPNYNASYKIIDGATSLSYNQTASYYTAGTASISATQRQLTSNYVVTGVGTTGNYEVAALILSGECLAGESAASEVRVTPKTTSMTTSTYDCNGDNFEWFHTLRGEYCYAKDGRAPICNPGYVYNNENNKNICEEWGCANTNHLVKADKQCYATVTPKTQGCPEDFPEDKGVCVQPVATTTSCPKGYAWYGTTKCFKAQTTTFGSWGSAQCTNGASGCPGTCRTKKEAEDGGYQYYYIKRSDTNCLANYSSIGSYDKFYRSKETGCTGTDKIEYIPNIGNMCVTENRDTKEATIPCPNGGKREYVGQLGGYRCKVDKETLTVPTCYDTDKYSYNSTVKKCVSKTASASAVFTGITQPGCEEGTYALGDSCKARRIANATCSK